jgi:hypothetical protein
MVPADMNIVSVATFQLFITHRAQRVQISKLVLVLLCIESEKKLRGVKFTREECRCGMLCVSCVTSCVSNTTELVYCIC